MIDLVGTQNHWPGYGYNKGIVPISCEDILTLCISFICSRSEQISFSTSPLPFLVATTHSSRLCGQEIFSRIGNEKDPEKRSPGGDLAVCLGFEPSSHQFRLNYIYIF
jgi:hypothetical protein